MKTIFGVSSLMPINKRLKNGYTMYDWIMRQKGFPSFCLRTLSGEDSIAAKEIEFLNEKNCKIGLVVRDLTEAKVSKWDGEKEALEAIEAAKALGVPENKGIALFAEIKPEWSVNHDWMVSYARTLFNNGYIPGFIGNTDSSKNFNFDRQCSHYIQTTKKDNYFNVVIMATEPKCTGTPTGWLPYCPSELNPEDMHLWMCGTTTFDLIHVDDVYAKDEKVIENMW